MDDDKSNNNSKIKEIDGVGVKEKSNVIINIVAQQEDSKNYSICRNNDKLDERSPAKKQRRIHMDIDSNIKAPLILSSSTSSLTTTSSSLLVVDIKYLAMDACFTAFDKDGDDRLSLAEFTLICRALFRNDKGHIYDVSQERLDQMFAVFDKNGDGHIDREEFQFCWNNWIKTIVRPVNAFLIVDVQNDFITGSLDISNCSAQHNGSEIIDPINNLLDSVDFDAVFYSLDWHPSDHVSFIDNVKMRPLDETSQVDADSAQVYDTVTFAGPPPMKQRLWPRHCVQDSWGAELHKDLKVVETGVKVYKGTNPEVDSYSVFWDNKKLSDTTLNAQLKMKGTTDIYVCGLAYDVCVGATAVDALSAGYRTILIDDCCRGVDLHDIENTKEKVISSFGVIVHSNEIQGMVEGRDRRPELGYKLAMELKNPDSVLSTRQNGIRKSI